MLIDTWRHCLQVQAAHEETSVELVHVTDQVVDVMEEKYNISKSKQRLLKFGT